MMKRVFTTWCVGLALLTGCTTPVETNREAQLKVTITSPFNDPEIGREWSKMTTLLEEHNASPGICLSSLSAAYFWEGSRAAVAHTLITNTVAAGTIDAEKLQIEIEFTEGRSPTTKSQRVHVTISVT